MTILIDSDILIEVTRARDAGILQRWERLGSSQDTILCSPISVAELWQGARPAEHGLIAALFHVLICVPIDDEVGRKAGEFLHKYRKGHGLQLGDALIAASAVLNEAVLWTRNRKHYPMSGVRFF